MTSAFITPQEAQDLVNDKNSVFIDATYGQPVEFTIPNAIHFDIDEIANQKAPLPHTLPDADYFSQKVGNLGINNHNQLIVFDRTGFWMAASRVWWMFRVFGHTNIRIINGGLQSWEGELTPYSPSVKSPKNFKASFNKTLYKSGDDIAANNDDFIVIDARPTQAFNAGHIYQSLNIPLPSIIQPNGRLQSLPVIEQILAPALEANKPITTTCGSGVTACAIAAAMYECGKHDVAVYDGSWMEWRSRQDSNLQPTA